MAAASARRGIDPSRGRSHGCQTRRLSPPRQDARMFAQSQTPRVLLVAGTRPECLKLASLVRALHQREDCTALLLNSGQHEDMVRNTFAHLGLLCDLSPGQLMPMSLSHAVRALRERIRAIAREHRAAL